jgi:hypothetical protein
VGEININIATYQTTPEMHGEGTFFFTDCGHKMYSIRDNMAYHGCLCPGCLYKGIQTTLYIRGSEEANKYLNDKLKTTEIDDCFIGGLKINEQKHSFEH